MNKQPALGITLTEHDRLAAVLLDASGKAAAATV